MPSTPAKPLGSLSAAMRSEHGVKAALARVFAAGEPLQGLPRGLVAGRLELLALARKGGAALVEIGKAANDGAKVGCRGVVGFSLHHAGAHRRRRLVQRIDDELAIRGVRRQRSEAG